MPDDGRKRWVRIALGWAACVGIWTVAVAGAAEPVSFHAEILPLFKRSCQGCHNARKAENDLQLTSFAKLSDGSKNGALFTPGDPDDSLLMDMIGGDEPEMPPKDKKGVKLTVEEVDLIARWIAEGAKDDTPAQDDSIKAIEPPVYTAAPVIRDLAFSPDGEKLAVTGYHEVLVHRADGSGLIARLVGKSPRIESLAFSSDGSLLVVSGGSPALYGEIQIWDVAAAQELQSHQFSYDTLYGVSISPDQKRIAFGCADKTARVIRVEDGKELLRFVNHNDWVLATTFSVDGSKLLTGSRDKTLKLIRVDTGEFIDDINNLLEGVMCFDRSPTEDRIAYGGALGTPRVYRMQANRGRTSAANDVNLVRAYERQPGPVRSIAYSPDGERLAVGNGLGEVRIYDTSNGERTATLTGHAGAVFAIDYHPGGDRIATGGFDGVVRIFDAQTGEPITSFTPVPLEGQPGPTVVAQPAEENAAQKNAREKLLEILKAL